MPEPVESHTDPARRPVSADDTAVRSAAETDPSLVALIRRVLDASGVEAGAHPGGPGESPGGGRAPEDRIGKFEVLGPIGRGGFGTVLLVRDPDLGRERALKLPNPETLGSPAALARFLGEARLASRVDHPNVVRIYEAETLGVLPYIVMEYCPGGSLGQWLAERAGPDRLPERWVAGLVAEVAEGVHQAHLAGLLHRDIKPANVLLERVGPEDEHGLPRFRPKIADFGLAKALEPDEAGPSMTVSGTPLGTWAYMSPEQARGDKRILETTDVYAIGAILYELLTGGRLFEGLTPPEILGRLLGPDPAPTPRAIRRDLHRDLETICRKSLEKSPSDRYQNASELANDLRRVLGGLPILARPAPIWKRGLWRVKRHPVRSALAGLALGSAVAGSLAGSQWRDQKRRGEVDVLLNDLESASLARFPELIPRVDPTDARVAARLRHLFRSGNPRQKFAAALTLAGVEPDLCSYGYAQLLRAEPREIGPIGRLLADRMPDLTARLAADVDATPPPGASPADAEALDRRRANAANALICLGAGGRGWDLLRFRPDPQARSFLIDQLGASGVAPRLLFGRLKAERDATIRRALILAAHEVPDGAWDEGLRAEVGGWVLERYEHDPDPGVHGASKWLLGRWNLAGRMREVDARLASLGRDDERRWRVGSPLRLTFVRHEDAETGRVVEIADTEITVGQILEWRKVPYLESASPGPDYPINGSSYLLAAEFLNWLSRQEKIGEDGLAYRPGSSDREPPLVPVDGQLDRQGYRLLTDREFELACRAGTSTPRYYGTSVALLSRYAWYSVPPSKVQSYPVGRLKPNDLGLFDMLGNVKEICQSTRNGVDPMTQSVACGGSALQHENKIESDARTARMHVDYSVGSNDYGFRVATTVRPRGAYRPSCAP